MRARTVLAKLNGQKSPGMSLIARTTDPQRPPACLLSRRETTVKRCGVMVAAGARVRIPIAGRSTTHLPTRRHSKRANLKFIAGDNRRRPTEEEIAAAICHAPPTRSNGFLRKSHPSAAKESWPTTTRHGYFFEGPGRSGSVSSRGRHSPMFQWIFPVARVLAKRGAATNESAFRRVFFFGNAA